MALEWPHTGFPRSVTALTTTRSGGVSSGAWRSLNLAAHVGDAAGAVTGNRGILQAALPPGARVPWLDQVHGTTVVDVAQADAASADGAICRQPGIACAILTADCLPVLLCDRAGRVVGAAHAGWRGLAAGVIEATVEAMGVPAADIMAWLGPCIGASAFEVGADVRDAFCGDRPVAESGPAAFFTPSSRPGRYLADLQGLARQRLLALGVTQTVVDRRCTFSGPEHFFSYRRDGVTGRMASLILINP